MIIPEIVFIILIIFIKKLYGVNEWCLIISINYRRNEWHYRYMFHFFRVCVFLVFRSQHIVNKDAFALKRIKTRWVRIELSADFRAAIRSQILAACIYVFCFSIVCNVFHMAVGCQNPRFFLSHWRICYFNGKFNHLFFKLCYFITIAFYLLRIFRIGCP